MDVQCPVGGAQPQAAVETPVLRFDVVCRVCGKEDENNIHIFGDDGLKRELALRMNTYLPIRVAGDDSLPLNCCWNCASLIFSWHELVTASIETDRKLKELLVVVAEPPTVRAVSPKVEIEREVVLPNTDTTPVKEEGEGSVNFRDMVSLIKKGDEDSTGTANSVHRKVEISKSNEMACLGSMENPEKPTCDVCRKSFSSDSALFCHKRTYHKEIASRITCNICNKTFGESCHLMRHKRNVHAMECPYTCRTCGKEFPEKTDYFSHVRSAHYKVTKRADKNLAKFFCNICNRGYVWKKGLVRHTITKHPKCSDLSTKAANLAKYKLVIDSQVLYECDVCRKRYSKPYAFSAHRQIHSKGTQTLHACDACGKRYATSRLLQWHRSQNHTARRFACRMCGAQFRTRSRLAQHVTIHSDKWPYACDVCGETFRQAFTLSVHKRCHGDLRYSYDVRGKGFRLRYHQKDGATRRARNGTYSCNLCGKAFRRRKVLQQHVSNHDPLATDPCDVPPAEIFERSQEES